MGKTLTLTVPDLLASELESANQEFLLTVLKRGLQEVKVDRALELYGRGGISFGAAAERAGVSRSVLARYAYARGMEPLFNVEIVDQGLRTKH